jgi:hypothetical protein
MHSYNVAEREKVSRYGQEREKPVLYEKNEKKTMKQKLELELALPWRYLSLSGTAVGHVVRVVGVVCCQLTSLSTKR